MIIQTDFTQAELDAIVAGRTVPTQIAAYKLAKALLDRTKECSQLKKELAQLRRTPGGVSPAAPTPQ